VRKSVYRCHYLKRVSEEIITDEQTENLILQLKNVHSMGCLVEGLAQAINQEEYFNRVTKIIDIANEL
jgi:hypothetical protein